MTRTSYIELEVDGVRKYFEINHAERLLRMKNNGGWKLPEDSEFDFNKINGITVKRNTGKIKKAGKPTGVK